MRDQTFFLMILFVLLDGSAAIIGALLPRALIHRHRQNILSFAAAVLLSISCLDLFPEASSKTLSRGAVLAVGALTFLFFIGFERIFSKHGSHDGLRPVTSAVLIGDAFHNIADGIAVAAAFLTDIRLGIASAIAVFFHELPQEAADYAILVHHGFSRARALIVLAIVQFSALIGALAVYFSKGWLSTLLPWLLAFSFGGFLYVSLWVLLREVVRHVVHSLRAARHAAFSFLVGIAIAGLMHLWL